MQITLTLNDKKLTADVAPDTLSGRCGVDKLGVFAFKLAQLAHKRVEGGVGDFRSVLGIIEVRMVLYFAT